LALTALNSSQASWHHRGGERKILIQALTATVGVPQRLLRWLTAYKIEGYSPRTARRLALINIVSAIGVALSIGYVVFYVVYDIRGLWALVLVVMIQCLLFAWTPFWHRFGEIAAALYFISVWLASITAIWILIGRDGGIQFYYLPGAAGMLLFLGLQRIRLSMTLAVLPLALFLFAELTPTVPADFVHIGTTHLAASYIANILFAYLIIFTMLFYAFNTTRLAEDALEREHARSERLLDNLLPESIARRLKDEPGQVIADHLSQVTILFADIVDFTPRAQRLSPPQLVDFLNRIFTEFDKAAEKHGLEKIKTIGDAYMVAAGMPTPRHDHTEAVAEMALDMLEITGQLGREIGEALDVRVGFHTGQAVAGVIGTQKYFYDVWGDTVNIAARMESQGEPGRIQVTSEVHDILAETYVFEPRGEIEVKGKSPIQTWWLIGRR
jgi:class 3 adenylate cyclase